METAGKAYAQNPDPDTKLGDLETMEMSKLKILQNRYKNIVSNRALISRLKDRGESARRTLAAVEAELATRASGGDSEPPALESRSAAAAAAEVDKLADRIARIEWDSGRRTDQRAELDSDDDPDPEEMPQATNASSPAAPANNCAARLAASPTSHGGESGGGAAAAATRQMLPKSATSRREVRFLMNRVRASGGEVPAPPVPGPARRTLLAQWSDSALAAPARPDNHTQLLDMDASLQLLKQHSRITQEERAAQLAARYAAVVDIEGAHMDLDAGSDDDMDDADRGPAVLIGGGEGS